MRGCISLFKKEMRSMLFTILVSGLLVTAWEIFLITRMNRWPLGMTFGLGFIPLGILPLIMLVQGYQSFRQEWKGNTIYLLKSLPRKGYEIVSSKLAASGIVYIILTLYTVGLHLFFHRQHFSTLMGEVPGQVAESYSPRMIVIAALIYLAIGIIPYIMSQFSYLVSCYFSKFKWLVSIVVFGLSHYLLGRISGFIARLFNWLPDIPLDIMWSGPYGQETATIYIGSAPIIAVVIVFLGFFFTGSWILEKQLDV
jgi:hypothetical protein